MENRYNLLDEQWIPVVGEGKVGLRRIFTDAGLTALGGNPIEKIAVFKLLLAIAQTACTPEDENGWKALGCDGMIQAVLDYLDSHRDCFWLYGERPFLQMPEIQKANKQHYGALKMEVAVGNTTVVTQIQSETPLDDAEKALLLIVQMNFAFGGKKVDNSIVLSDGYEKSKTGKPGTSLGFMGFLHSFVMLPTLLESIYVNLFPKESILGFGGMFPVGVGTAPWEKMPAGEKDSVADMYKKSYMSRLISLNRFLYLSEDGAHYSEGLQLPDYAESYCDASIAVDFYAKPKPKVIWTNPERRPWRQLTSLLAFLDGKNSSSFICYQLKAVFSSARLNAYPSFIIWSAGVKVSSNSGEQYLTGTDDFVESEIQFQDYFRCDSQNFYESLESAMAELERMNKVLYACVSSYYKNLKVDGKSFASNATSVFWQLCEHEFQHVVDICSGPDAQEGLQPLYRKFWSFVNRIYDANCPKDTARQMEAWAKNRPGIKNVKEER